MHSPVCVDERLLVIRATAHAYVRPSVRPYTLNVFSHGRGCGRLNTYRVLLVETFILFPVFQCSLLDELPLGCDVAVSRRVHPQNKKQKRHKKEKKKKKKKKRKKRFVSGSINPFILDR